MNATFKTISDSLDKAGFKTPLEEATGKMLDFKLTPYSLNTSLSFRFENLDEFTEFLNVAGHGNGERASTISTAFIELGLNPKEFFYVNFFEKGKELEM